jgi:hypothetical protein
MIYILNDAGKVISKLINSSENQALQYIRAYKLLDKYLMTNLVGKAMYELSDSDFQDIVKNLAYQKHLAKIKVTEIRVKTQTARWDKYRAVKEVKAKIKGEKEVKVAN